LRRGGGASREAERSSFLKKRSKRLLTFGVRGLAGAYAKEQKFFGSFFSKKNAS
jgi:hypothetical protein